MVTGTISSLKIPSSMAFWHGSGSEWRTRPGLPGETVTSCSSFGEGSHQFSTVVGVFKAVKEHVVDDFTMAEPHAGPGTGSR